jgi:hypothetical protein
MAKTTRVRRGAGRLSACLCLVVALGPGCASQIFSQRVVYDYFAAPRPDDPWMRKIGQWQARERWELGDAPAAAPAAVAGASVVGPEPERPIGDLRSEYDAFRAAQRRSLARDLALWIQSQARDHYVPDGPIDRWATLAETLAGNGDDCDGLELLVYRLLREFGFGSDEVYRAIVVRPSDGQHHMVTLWFEDRSDPWVIDPTGAMTTGMPRISEVPGWKPLKIFSESERFTVESIPLARVAR